jgi:hypothetical protein
LLKNWSSTCYTEQSIVKSLAMIAVSMGERYENNLFDCSFAATPIINVDSGNSTSSDTRDTDDLGEPSERNDRNEKGTHHKDVVDVLIPPLPKCSRTGRDLTWTDLLNETKNCACFKYKQVFSTRDCSLWLYQRMQTMSFKKDIAALKKEVRVTKDSKLRNFVPFKDVTGLLRVRTRIQTGNDNFKSSIVLDSSHEWT